VENIRFTFAGDARVYEWEPDGGFEETDWDFEIFSPDGEWVVLLQSTDGPYHVVATSRLKQYLLGEFAAAKLHAIDAVDHPGLDGNDTDNIANRTLLGMGGHLELTGPLRSAMFGVNSRPRRKDTTTEVFWDFAAACRNALARLEAGQVIL